MSDSNLTYSNEIEMLQSPDPSVRRSTIEDFMGKEIDENVVKMICGMLSDEDKGVKDAASFTLIFNGNPLIPKFVVPLVSSEDISVRNLAGEVLLRIGEPAIDEMAAYIAEASDDDKKFVIDLLGLIGNDRPVGEIFKVLKANKNENVILSCIEALGNIGTREALDELILIYDSNELYKPTITEAIGKMKSEEALAFILSKYEIEDDLTKFSIIESLGIIGNEATFYFLLTELTKIEGPLVWPLIASLQSLKEKFGFDIPFDESIKHSILYTLIEAEAKYKRAAASLVTVFEDKEIMEALIRIYGEDAEVDENIKPAFFEHSFRLYPKIGAIIRQNPSNLKNLLWLIKDMVDFDGSESIQRLSEVDKRNLSDAMTLCMDNPDEEVRKSAMELLFIVNLDCALVFVDAMIEDDNIWNRLKLLEIVEGINKPEINKVLKQLSNDPEEMIRDRASWALSQRGITNIENKAE